MKIDGTSMSPVRSVKAANRLNQTPTKTSLSEPDKVAVSDKAQVYQDLIQKTKDLPPVREDLVRTLSEQIERGEYQVDGQKIAEKINSAGF